MVKFIIYKTGQQVKEKPKRPLTQKGKKKQNKIFIKSVGEAKNQQKKPPSFVRYVLPMPLG